MSVCLLRPGPNLPFCPRATTDMRERERADQKQQKKKISKAPLLEKTHRATLLHTSLTNRHVRT